MTLTAPYNFVPLNHEVLIPEWWDKISQDIPFSDGEDGCIRVVFKNLSPIFIREGRSAMYRNEKCSMEQPYLPEHVKVNGRNRYFLPATSVKGMLRSVMEIMSMGKMQQYNNDSFGYRTFGKSENLTKQYRENMVQVRCGWLRHKKDSDDYEILVSGEPEKIAHAELPYGDKTLPDTEINGKILVCSGPMKNKNPEKSKHHEHLFVKPEQCEEIISVSSETVDEFVSVYKPSPKPTQERIAKFRRDEGELPVFYTYDADGIPTHIGLSRNFRYPYAYNVSAGVHQQWLDSEGREVSEGEREVPMDLAECIMGTVKGRRAMRGRVQVSHAFCDRDVEPLPTVSGVLGQPQASYYPLYLRQDKAAKEYTSYEDESLEIAGHKRYRIHESKEAQPLPEGNGKETVKSYFRPLPVDCEFACTLTVHNLRAVEIGALLSALTFHRTPGCYHSIGMAKSFGYGKLQTGEPQLVGLSHDTDYYLKAYEMYMTTFTEARSHCDWTSSPQIRMLMAIASLHSEVGLKMMGLEDYRYYKQSAYKEILNEPSVNIPSLVTPLDRKRDRMAPQYQEARRLYEAKQWNEALSAYESLKKNLLPTTDQEVEDAIESIRQAIRRKAEEERAAAEKKIEEEKQRKLAEGLAFLQEKYKNGPNEGQYKICDFKVAQQRIDKYLKQSGQPLSPADLDILRDALPRYYKANDKQWATIDGKVWQKVRSWTSVEWMSTTFTIITK